MDRITCPLCIDLTGPARTNADQRHATVLPFTFAATAVEVIPCQFCIADKAIASVTIAKSRVIALAWDGPCTGESYAVNPDAPEEGHDIFHAGPCSVHHVDGLVEFS